MSKRKYNYWFVSDTHFGHANILKESFGGGRPFETIEEMNEALINNINASVDPEDTIIFLGDVFFLGTQRARAIMDRINGTKVLVKGNHDGTDTQMRNKGFDVVVDRMDLMIQGQRVHFSHFPYRESKWHTFKKKYIWRTKQTRYLWLRLIDKGNWLCHGHTHSKEKIKNKMIHLGVDAWDFKPVHISVLEHIIQTGKVPKQQLNKRKGIYEWKI